MREAEAKANEHLRQRFRMSQDIESFNVVDVRPATIEADSVSVDTPQDESRDEKIQRTMKGQLQSRASDGDSSTLNSYYVSLVDSTSQTIQGYDFYGALRNAGLSADDVVDWDRVLGGVE